MVRIVESMIPTGYLRNTKIKNPTTNLQMSLPDRYKNLLQRLMKVT
jgi:hypothetical protein